jgi:hypothetical protein
VTTNVNRVVAVKARNRQAAAREEDNNKAVAVASQGNRVKAATAPTSAKSL